MFRDTAQNAAAELFAVMKGELIVRPAASDQESV
jgi:hypothetical protein